MVLEWFSGAREDSINDLVRRKRYGKAIKLLRLELGKRRNDRRLGLRLGEILVLAGEREEGARVLANVADEMVKQGQVAQAIATLKKIQAIEPGREDVEDKLAYLVERHGKPWDPWSSARAAIEVEEEGGEGLEIGIEAGPRSDTPVGGAAAPAPPGRPDEPGDDAPAAADEAPLSDEAMRAEILALITDTFGDTASPAAEDSGMPAADAAAGPSASGRVVKEPAFATPLFFGFAREELVALIRGLRLLAFEPGEIIVSEGEAGASLFVLTSGSVRAYVRTTTERQVQIRRLKEGDFFGEISVLTGSPRSATVTAASHCELLELDKPTLDRIAETHPHVRKVLQEFHAARKDSTLETLSRGLSLPRPSPPA
jgi:hypothetical protein